MKNKEEIQAMLEYITGMEKKGFRLDETAVFASYLEKKEEQSLVIKIVSVLGGILASLAFLGFIFESRFDRSSTGMVLLGTLCLASSTLVGRKSDRIILDTLRVSGYLCAFLLLVVGLNGWKLGENEIAVVFILVAIFTIIVVHLYLLVFISVLVINGSILFLLLDNHHEPLFPIWVALLAIGLTSWCMKEARLGYTEKFFSKRYKALRMGLVCSYLIGLVFAGNRYLVHLPAKEWWPLPVIALFSILYTVSRLFEILHVEKGKSRIWIYLFCFLLFLSVWLSPAIPGALLLILLCFLVKEQTGLVLGVLVLIYIIAQNYYDLEYSLLTKSLWMLCTGGLFLILYGLTKKPLQSNEKI